VTFVVYLSYQLRVVMYYTSPCERNNIYYLLRGTIHLC